MVFGSCHGRKTSTNVVVAVRWNIVPVGVPRPGIDSVVPVTTQDDGAPIRPALVWHPFFVLAVA